MSVFQFEIQTELLTLESKPSQAQQLGTGVHIWEASKVLSKYIQKNKKSIKYDTCLEVGSGCGLLGISCAVMGAKQVVLTDQKQMLDILQNNVQNNKQSWKDICDQVLVMEWDWNDDIINKINSKNLLEQVETKIQDEIKTFDLIVGADCIFTESLIYPLLNQLLKVSSNKTNIYICNEKRCENCDNSFIKIANELFEVRKIPHKKHHQDYNSEHINIFHLKKK